MDHIGFIGAGNMAEALVKGLLSSGEFGKVDISVSDISKDRLDYMSTEYGVYTTGDNKEIARRADLIILAVKPNHIVLVVDEIRTYITKKKMLVSIAAGMPISHISKAVNKKAKIVRVMPNTPALVMSGVSVLYCNDILTKEDREQVKKIFEYVGIVYLVADEKMLDAVTGLSGSGPAFVSMFIEALSDGGVKMGLPRQMAQALAAQTVYGTAKMIIESDAHPGEFKDKVTSPGGTTIQGIHQLEKTGFRNSAISAVEAATLRSKELSKEEK